VRNQVYKDCWVWFCYQINAWIGHSLRYLDELVSWDLHWLIKGSHLDLSLIVNVHYLDILVHYLDWNALDGLPTLYLRTLLMGQGYLVRVGGNVVSVNNCIARECYIAELRFEFVVWYRASLVSCMILRENWVIYLVITVVRGWTLAAIQLESSST